MGFLSDLFLGTKPKLRTGTVNTLSPEQQAMLGQLLSSLGLSPEDMGLLQDIEQSNIDFTSPATDVGRAADELLQILINSPENIKRTPEQEQAMKRLVEILNAPEQDIEDFLGKYETQATMDLTETALPQLDRKFANRYFSSDRAKQEERLLENFGIDLATIRANMGMQARSERVRNALAAAGLIDQSSGSMFDRALQAAATGIESDLGRSGSELQEFQVNQRVQEARINAMLNLLGIPTREPYAVTQEGSAGLISQFLGGVSKGAGTALGGWIV